MSGCQETMHSALRFIPGAQYSSLLFTIPRISFLLLNGQFKVIYSSLVVVTFFFLIHIILARIAFLVQSSQSFSSNPLSCHNSSYLSSCSKLPNHFIHVSQSPFLISLPLLHLISVQHSPFQVRYSSSLVHPEFLDIISIPHSPF